jgi:uncharacterized protein
MKVGHLDIDESAIKALCEKYRLTELSLFGSVLRDDFRDDSDVDVLIEFRDDVQITLEMYDELEADLARTFGRKVDVLRKKYLRNPFIRYEVLTTRRKLYAAAA